MLCMVLLGNKHLLSRDAMWSRLLEHYESRGKLIEANQFMS